MIDQEPRSGPGQSPATDSQSGAFEGVDDRTAEIPKNHMACEEGFEPPNGGLEMPRLFLTNSHLCLRLAVAILVVLCLSGRLDAQTANVLWKVFLP